MDTTEAMRGFVKVVSLGSYAEAARALGLTRSALSKAVAGLEHRLGARLLDRTTRRISPTEAGRAYYESSLDILARLDETEMRVARLNDEPRGVLKMNAPVSFGEMHLAPLVPAFMALYPDVKIELTLNDRFIDPVEEGVDLTLRIGVLEDSSLVARRLAPVRRLLVAAPAYLAASPPLRAPEDLAQHRCLDYGHTSHLRRWGLLQEGDVIEAPLNVVLCSNNGGVLRAAALAGQGIANLPSFLVGPDVKAGRLALVLPGAQPTGLGLYVLYAPNRYLAAKSRLMIDFLSRNFSASPAWDEG